jgi:hypothetical protein
MDNVQKYLLSQSYVRIRAESKQEKCNNHQTEIEKYELFEKDF